MLLCEVMRAIWKGGVCLLIQKSKKKTSLVNKTAICIVSDICYLTKSVDEAG